MMKTALIYDSRFLDHKTGDSPECPERLTVILDALQKEAKLWDSLAHLAPRMATDEDILRCHTPELLKQIQAHCPHDDSYYFLDSDTVISKDSDKIAHLAAGAALTAIDEIFSGKLKNAFALIRPPGHHATHTTAMGFCLFNNAAIAARYAQTKHHAKKILIIDWDVHHGNGTQDIFYSDPSVFYFSMHEFPFYPGTGHDTEEGEGSGLGTTLNIPLEARTPAPTYREAFSQALSYIGTVFPPDFIIISAGFDSRKGDPLGEFQLNKYDFAEMTKEVMAMADKYCHGRLISLLEGGYVNETLGDVVKSHVQALTS